MVIARCQNKLLPIAPVFVYYIEQCRTSIVRSKVQTETWGRVLNFHLIRNGPFAASGHMVHAGGHPKQRKFKFRSRFVLDVPVGRLPSSMYHVTASCKRPIGVHYKKDRIKISQFTKYEVLSLDCNRVEGFQKIEKIRNFVWIGGRHRRIRH